MQNIIAFATFSTRRQEEITRISWTDFEPAHRWKSCAWMNLLSAR
jgi:hypothetical protein